MSGGVGATTASARKGGGGVGDVNPDKPNNDTGPEHHSGRFLVMA